MRYSSDSLYYLVMKKRSIGRREKALEKANLTWVKGNYGRNSNNVQIFAYTLEDISKLLGIKIQSVRNLGVKGINFADLKVLCEEFMKRNKDK